MITVFLGGEGPTELGRYARAAAFRNAEDVGVLEALVRGARPGAEVSGGLLWKDIRHYKAGGKRSREQRLVLGLCLRAKESGAAAVVFARDRDGDTDRERAIANAMVQARSMWPTLKIVGGLPVEKIESWMIALCAHEPADHLTEPKDRAKELGVRREAAVTQIEAGHLALAESKSPSLSAWMQDARSTLAV